MNPDTDIRIDQVGPVLQSGAVADAVLTAIKQLNRDVVVVDRGAYRRVLVPHRCIVTREVIEQHLGRSWHFPGDLEMIMPAFKGTFTVSEEMAVWAFESTARLG